MVTHEIAWDAPSMTESNAGQRQRLAQLGAVSRVVAMIALCGAIASGIAYELLQYLLRREAVDLPFTFLAIGATAIAVFGERAIRNSQEQDALDFFLFTQSLQGDDGRFKDSPAAFQQALQHLEMIWGSRKRILAGLAYAAVLTAAPFILNTWSGDVQIKWALIVFIFFVNYVAGSAIASLLSYGVSLKSLLSLVKINIWDTYNPAVSYVLGTTGRASLVAVLYVSVAMSSLSVSPFGINAWVLFYGAACLVCLVVSITVPYFYIVLEISKVKKGAVRSLSRVIDRTMNEGLESVIDLGSVEKLKTASHLIELRSRIETISIFPVKMRAFLSFGSVLIVSTIPVVAQYLFVAAR